MLRQIIIGLLVIAAGSFIALKIDAWTEEAFKGDFHVVDGDTLRLGAARLRLLGFDAPELTQRCGEEGAKWPCGRAAKDALQELVKGPDFHCKGGKEDRYGRTLVFCFAAGRDVGELMVSRGMAVATQRLLYQREQRLARDRQIGLWSGPFERPVDWRKLHKRAELDPPLAALVMVVRRAIGW